MSMYYFHPTGSGEVLKSQRRGLCKKWEKK